MRHLIKDLGKVSTGNTPSKKETAFYNSEDIGFVKPDIISDSEITDIVDTSEYISENARRKARIVPEGTVFVTCIGSIGKVGIARGKEYAFNQQINAIEPNEKVLAEYLAYCIFYNKKQLVNIANAPVVPIINKSQFENFEINIASDIATQKEQLSALTRVAKVIALRRKQLAELDMLVKARFVELFEQSKWEQKTIGDISSFCSRGKSPQYVESSDLCVINQACIYWDGIRLEKVKYNESQYVGDRVLNQGDVLINSTGTGTLGRCNVFEICDSRRYMADSHVTIVRFVDILPIYFKCWFEKEATQNYLYSNCVSGSTNQIELSREKLRKMSVSVPPLELQNQFADFVKQVDKSKVAVQKALDEAQLLFDSLMQKYFG